MLYDNVSGACSCMHIATSAMWQRRLYVNAVCIVILKKILSQQNPSLIVKMVL